MVEDTVEGRDSIIDDSYGYSHINKIVVLAEHLYGYFNCKEE